MVLNSFTEFAIIVSVAALFSTICTKLKQPSFLGFILAGILFRINPFWQIDYYSYELFSQLGITLLLFTLGLELDVRELQHLGKSVLIIALVQLGIISAAGYFFSLFLGFNPTASIYIALAIGFSSVIVVVKLLSSQKTLETLFGRLSVGLLLIQDFIFVLVLVALSAYNNFNTVLGAGRVVEEFFFSIGKGAIVLLAVFLLVKYLLHPLIDHIRQEKEILFLIVIAWALILSAIMNFAGFTLEFGGLIAGISLSKRFEHLQIDSWMRPLRDFFLLLFFVLVGLQIDISVFSQVLVPAILLSIFVLLLKPIVLMITMKYLNYSKRVAFMTAICTAQVSEFSLILAKYDFDVGRISSSILTLITLVGIFTMIFSSYAVLYSSSLYRILEPFLDLLSFKAKRLEKLNLNNKVYDVVLFGCHRTGKNLLHFLNQNQKRTILVIDLDPVLIDVLSKDGVNAVCGDLMDKELYDVFNIAKAKIIISTVPSRKENLSLLEWIRFQEKKPMTIVYANDGFAVEELYDRGADFVVYPHILAGNLLSKIVSKGFLTKQMVQMREKILENLNGD